MNFRAFPEFIGQTYQAAAVRAAAEQTVNLYPELIPGPGGGKGRLVLWRTPGLGLLQTLADQPARGALNVNGRVFVVAGGSFIELTSLTSSVVRGAFAASGTSPVDIDTNGVQVCVIADGLGYIFTLASNAWQQVVGTTGFPAYAEGLSTIDTYFITFDRSTNRFSLSGLLDGTAWSGLDIASTQQPDNLVGLAQSHLYLWLFGNKSIEIFQDTGDNNTPFQRVPGAEIDQGCGAAHSIVALDNTLFWLGDDTRGPAVIYRADGFLPTRISNHAIEHSIQSYSRHDDAVAFAYQESGHLYYAITFPSARNGTGSTHVYDVATQMWHERGWWNLNTGLYEAHRALYHVFAWNTHIVLDFQGSGNVYQMAAAIASDDGNPLRWLRAAPHLLDSGQWIFYNAFELDAQMGGGLPDPAQAAQVMLRWSDDAGSTWSGYRQMSMGALGEYKTRAIARRLGRSRSRVFEVSGTDAIPELCLIGAGLDIAPGTS